MSVAHWEAYYRGGAISACPMGPNADYTLELRDTWSDFFSRLASGAAVLDIGTGNGAIPLIARQTAESLGRHFEIHGIDLARIDPLRDVADGARLFAGIVFHPGTAAESLPFQSATFAAVSGQYALEYTDVRRTLPEVLRVLRPGGSAQFIMHHADSVVLERARTSLQHSDVVLNRVEVYRKLRSFLEAERCTPSAAGQHWQELLAALAALQETGRLDPGRRVIDVTLDAVPKLLSLRRRFPPAALLREVDSVERDLRHAACRHNDLIVAAATGTMMDTTAECARANGFADVRYQPLYHAKQALVAWQLRMHRPVAP
ncbi:MAG TPA: class I SAM-dependent methyltransferase [Steroidobacteraceae bacterium]|nr:class I SAM-dependent methyltransferase [Steroidobacteraceae bacterium]